MNRALRMVLICCVVGLLVGGVPVALGLKYTNVAIASATAGVVGAFGVSRRTPLTDMTGWLVARSMSLGLSAAFSACMVAIALGRL